MKHRPKSTPYIVELIRALRVSSKMTQEAFSKHAKISYKYYQAIEAGRKQNLCLSTLERLADAHGVPVRKLLP